MEQINIMALRHSAFYSPLLMTIAGGYLQRIGLRPVYTVQTQDNTVVDSINRSQCHVAQSAVATSFAELEKNRLPDIVHFAQINARDGFFLTGRDADPDFQWSRLKGKKILADHFFQPMAMLKYGLYKQGVEFGELEIIDAGDVDAMDRAFRDGIGDYVHQQGPAPQQMEKDGIGHVVAAVGDAVGPVAFSSLCGSREWVQTDMAKAFMLAYRESLNYVLEAPAKDIAIQLQQVGFFAEIDPQVLARTLGAYQNLGCWQADPQIDRDTYERLLDVFLYNGLIGHRHAMELSVVPPPA
jgi:NitT/TauT family transport system substrate-binding protein